MVTPICVEYPEFGFGRISFFSIEIFNDFVQVISIHSQAVCLAEWSEILRFHINEAAEVLKRLYVSNLILHKSVEVLLPAFDLVDHILAYRFVFFLIDAVVENEET